MAATRPVFALMLFLIKLALKGFYPGLCCRALSGLSGMNTGTAELIRVSPPEAVVNSNAN